MEIFIFCCRVFSFEFCVINNEDLWIVCLKNVLVIKQTAPLSNLAMFYHRVQDGRRNYNMRKILRNFKSLLMIKEKNNDIMKNSDSYPHNLFTYPKNFMTLNPSGPTFSHHF